MPERVAREGQKLNPPDRFVRELFGDTLEVAYFNRFWTLDLAVVIHYILYIALATTSSLNGHKSSIEPPPRPTIKVSRL